MKMSHVYVLIIGGLTQLFSGGGLPQFIERPEQQSWQLSPQPVLEIGPSGGEQNEWGSIAGMTRMTTGQITVADQMNRELSFYAPDGRHENTVGRRGEGPGEFRFLRRPLRCGENAIFAWDPGSSRVTVFDSGASYVRDWRDSSLRIEEPGEPPLRMDQLTCNANGMFVTVSRRMDQLPRVEGPTEADVRIDIGREGAEGTTLGWFPGNQRYFAQGAIFPRPLGRRTLVALGSDRVFVGTTDEFEVAVFSLEGAPMGVIRDDVERVPITRSVIGAFLEDNGGAGGSYGDIEFPDFLPSYSRLLVDPEDNLWIQEYGTPSQTDSTWRVYGADGELRAILHMDEGFEVFEVGLDYVLGRKRDDFDVPSVLMYDLIKGTG